MAGTETTNDTATHEQKLADGQPLATPEDAQAAWEELAAAAGVIEATPAGEAPAPSPAPTPAPEPTGFNNEPEGIDKPAATPAPTAAPAATPAPTAAPQVETVTVPKSELEALTLSVKQLGGRVSKMQGELEKRAQSAAQATAAAGGDAPTQTAIAAASGSTAKWEKLKQEFPEWSEALEERLGQAGTQAPANIDEIRKQAREEAMLEGRTEAIRVIEENREAQIAEKHPEWKTTILKPEFHSWFNTKDDKDKVRWYNSHRADTITEMLDTYQTEMAALSGGAQKQQGVDSSAAPAQQSTSSAPAPAAARRTTAPAHDLAAAVTARGRAVPSTTKSESEMTDQELWNAEAAKVTAELRAAGKS
jgi:hypothetical protein